MKTLLYFAALVIVIGGCTKEKDCFSCKTTVKMDYSSDMPDATSSTTEDVCQGDIEAYKKARTSKSTTTATSGGVKVTLVTTSSCNCVKK